jgi:ketosteroid isomerase-like protein
MSMENVEVVRGLAEAFRRRQHERVFESYDPNIEWDATRTPTGAAEGVYHGHDGVRAFWREWLSAWSDLEFEVEDVRAAGTLVVLLIRNQRHWGRHSGIETRTQPYGMVFTFRDGKIVRNCIFPDRESALSAAGLSE